MKPTKTEEMDNLDRSMMNREIKLVVLIFPTKKKSGSDGFAAKFYETFR